jgi:rSAM/selenodomain-associated transferase 1
MARSPSAAPESIKTRLALVVPAAADRRALHLAFLQDEIESARKLAGIDLVVAHTPEGTEGFESIGLEPDELIPQRGMDLGERERNVFEDLFKRGYDRVVIIGSDLPTLPMAHVGAAFDALRQEDSVVVLGPAQDGGYYSIGLSAQTFRLKAEATTATTDALFSGIRWSTAFALEDTIAAAKRARLNVHLLPEWYDVDDESGLKRLMKELRASEHARCAPATVRELARLGLFD